MTTVRFVHRVRTGGSFNGGTPMRHVYNMLVISILQLAPAKTAVSKPEFQASLNAALAGWQIRKMAILLRKMA